MKKSDNAKLKLNKETLKLLDDGSLQNARGMGLITACDSCFSEAFVPYPDYGC